MTVHLECGLLKTQSTIISSPCFRSHELESLTEAAGNSSVPGLRPRGVLELHGAAAGGAAGLGLPAAAGRWSEDSNLLQDIAALRRRQQEYLSAASSLVA